MIPKDSSHTQNDDNISPTPETASKNFDIAKSVISLSEMANIPADMVDPKTILSNQEAIEAALNASSWLVIR